MGALVALSRMVQHFLPVVIASLEGVVWNSNPFTCRGHLLPCTYLHGRALLSLRKSCVCPALPRKVDALATDALPSFRLYATCATTSCSCSYACLLQWLECMMSVLCESVVYPTDFWLYFGSRS